MPEKVFVVGTGRCGTHTIQHLLGRVPGTLALHEGRGELSGRNIDVGDMKALNIYLYFVRCEVEARKELHELRGEPQAITEKCFDKRRKLITRCVSNDLHFVDVNRMGYNAIDYISSTYPNAKFIHLVRNGYDCVRSWYRRLSAYNDWFTILDKHNPLKKKLEIAVHNLKRYVRSRKEFWADLQVLLRRRGGGSMSAEDVRLMNRNNQLMYSLEKPRPLREDTQADGWSGFNRLQKLSWFWQHVNEKIQNRLASRVSQNCSHVFRIEDLNRENLGELCAFAGLEVPPNPTFRRHDKSETLSELWSARNVKAFNEIAGESMERFGYEKVQPQI